MGTTTAGTLMLNPNPNSMFRGFWWSPAPGDIFGHVDWINFLMGAKVSLKVWMYHLTHLATLAALKKLKAQGIEITIILDKGGLTRDKNKQAADELTAAGITIVESSEAFTIMHGKTALRDYGTPDCMVAVTTENLTGGAWTYTRDMGVLLNGATEIEDLNNLFTTCVKNAANNGEETPPFKSDIIACSPANSLAKLLDFVNGAKKNLVLVFENIGDEQFNQALINAAARGVSVMVMVPDCVESSEMAQATRNWTYIELLMKGGVQVRVVRLPDGTKEYTPDLPYHHVKAGARDVDPEVFAALLNGTALPEAYVAFLRDGTPVPDNDAWFYIGSENASFNSLEKAREIGLVAQDLWVAIQILTRLLADWNIAIPATSRPTWCPLIGN